jgi:Neuraminidase (sialidase)
MPNVITDSSGNWLAMWQSDEDLGGTAGGEFDIFFSRSTDNGATWTAAQTLNSNADSDTRGDWFSEY